MPTNDSDNVAILLTPTGAAAIAVVRLCGPGVRPLLDSHFSRPLTAGRAVHGEVRDGDAVIDDPVVVLDEARATADVSLHGGTWVVRAFLELARRAGFQIVEHCGAPLDERAVEGSSQVEREVLTHLPLARTELALRMLLAQPRAWAALKREEGEAPAEPGVSVDSTKTGSAVASPSHQSIGSILADRALHWLLHPPRVAIVGPANAGKSTLANQLFAQERSITADLPGTTRDWVGDVANVDGLAVMLVDTPGLRDTGDVIEAEAIALATPQIARADLVVLVLDQARPLAGEQEQLLARFHDSMVVVNKIDRPAAWAAPARAIRTVATTGQGVDELRRAIRRHFTGESLDIDRPRWWTERQRTVLQRSVADPARLSEL